MTLELKWGAPPAEALANPTQSNSFYVQVAAALRANPNEWAQVPREFASEDSAKNTATRIRQGRMASMPKGEFEAVSHGKDLWVRHTPPAEDEGEGNGGSVHPFKRPPAAPSTTDASKVREWARSKGMDVPKHGRLSQELIDAYDVEHVGEE
jgi:hypothetical protein